jgi:hypothetical protein
MHPAQVPLELGEVLPALELLDQLAPRPFVPLRERLQHAVSFQQPDDRLEALLKVRVRADDRHAASYRVRVREPI